MEDFRVSFCFALTELSHGSNVKGIKTTATFDPSTQEFIINTPSNNDMKFWIGGAAKTANVCVCFAQLIVGGKNEGVHAFIVPLRDLKYHMPLPGITLGDCGRKLGLDGIDNGFIIFDNVRIPKENFLDRLSKVSSDGVFSSPIKSAEVRFGLSLGGLSTGRIICSKGMYFHLCRSVAIALRYGVMRSQFADP